MPQPLGLQVIPKGLGNQSRPWIRDRNLATKAFEESAQFLEGLLNVLDWLRFLFLPTQGLQEDDRSNRNQEKCSVID